MKIRFLGTHNTESKTSKLVTFLIDEVLAVEASSLTSELTFTEQERVKAILLSHCHYDHIRDLPAFAFGNSSHSTDVFGTRETLQIASSHLADGVIYPEFAGDNPFLAKPVLRLCPVKPFQSFDILGYKVVPISVQHPANAVGYEISRGGRRMFYTGDTGSGLADIWQYISPQLLIAELTLPNRLSDIAVKSQHLCTEKLRNELLEFQRAKGYLPRVSLVHLTPQHEAEIAEEVKKISEELRISITLTAEGDEIIL